MEAERTNPPLDPRTEYIRVNAKEWRKFLDEAIRECDKGIYKGDEDATRPLEIILATCLSPSVKDRPTQLVELGFNYENTLQFSLDNSQYFVASRVVHQMVEVGYLRTETVLTKLRNWVDSCSPEKPPLCCLA